MQWLGRSEKILVPAQASGGVIERPLGLGALKAFLDAGKEYALSLQDAGESVKALFRQVLQAVVVFGNQPLFGLDVAAVLAFEKDFPAPKSFQKLALMRCLREIRVLRRWLGRVRCGHCPLCCLSEFHNAVFHFRSNLP